MRAFALLVAFCAGCASDPPQRDVFVPPYAEKGCWAQVHEQAGFAGPMRRFEGPIFVEAMRGAPIIVPNVEEVGAQPLFSEARSLALGPHMKLVGYAEPLFRNPSIFLGPGARLADLGSVGFHEKVASFELLCEA